MKVQRVIMLKNNIKFTDHYCVKLSYCVFVVRDTNMLVCKSDISVGAEMSTTNMVKLTTVTCLAGEIGTKTVEEAWQIMYMKFVSNTIEI